jgi:S-(hydroxymethyl)glutathione dehydrogenase / alcohol dehydrogenase
MKVRAAIAREAGRPLGLETVDVEGPRADEVLIEIKAAGICHTGEYTLSVPIPKASSRRCSAMRAQASWQRSDWA